MGNPLLLTDLCTQPCQAGTSRHLCGRASLQAVDGGVKAALDEHGACHMVRVEQQMLAVLRVHQGSMQSINGCCCNCVRLLATGSIACIITCDRITTTQHNTTQHNTTQHNTTQQ